MCHAQLAVLGVSPGEMEANVTNGEYHTRKVFADAIRDLTPVTALLDLQSGQFTRAPGPY
jgi:hypothetical protein